MKKIALLSAIAFCLTGCGKDVDVNAFLNEWDSVVADVVKKIDAGDADAAKIAFDGKKASLKRQWDMINKLKDFQISDDVKRKIKESRTKNKKALDNTMTKTFLSKEPPPDKAKFDKHKAIIDEYDDIFRYPLETL